MKRITKLLPLMLALCLILSVGALASSDLSAESGAVAPGTYTDGVNTLVIAEDMTFSMDKTGQNMDGGEFVLTVTGTVDAVGNFALTGLFDGELNLIEMATEDQIAADLASVQAAYAAGASAPAAAAVVPGTYTDGASTLIIAEDMTFSMDKTGQNMDGGEFVLTVTGTIDAAGSFALTGLFDGELNLIEMATEEQIAADLASVQAVYAAATAAPSAEAGAAVPGTYTDGVNTLIIAEDMTFSMDKTGQNMDGGEFVLTVTGTVDAAGNFTVTGLFDGELNLIEMATEEQIAADLASVQAAFQG